MIGNGDPVEWLFEQNLTKRTLAMMGSNGLVGRETAGVSVNNDLCWSHESLHWAKAMWA